ncbi:hypothetical protein PRNP1_002108 [Phytophthora ramorum]
MSLSRRFLSLPQELEGTSLPPQVSGKRCGTVVLCVGHILESAVSSRPLPSVSLVRVRWWGEQQPSSLFRPSLLSAAPVAGEEPRTIAMKYPVRVPPDQLVAYFSDMKDLTLDVIDRGSKKKFGECKLKLDVESDNSVLTAEEKLVALRREDALCEIKPSGAGQENEVLGYLAVSFDVQWGDFKKEDFEGEFSAWSSASSVSLPSKREWTDFEVEKEDSSPLDVESELRSVAGEVKMGLKMEMDEVVESRGSRDDFQRIQRLLNKGKALKQSMERAVKEKGGQEEDAGKHIYENRAMKQVRDALLLTSSEELGQRKRGQQRLSCSSWKAEFSGHIHVFQSLLAEDASKYFSSGQLIIEVWLHASKETDRTLLGLSKLPLRNFAKFLRREGSDLHGFSAQSLPFIGVDGRFPIDNPFNGNHAGYLRARVCIGTAEQLLTFATIIRSFVKFQAAVRVASNDQCMANFDKLSSELAMQARMVLTPEVVTNLQEACANVMVLLWCDTCNAPHEIGSSEVPMASVLYRAQGIRGMFPIRVGTELSAARVGVHCFVDHSLLDSPRDISNDGSTATDGNSRLCDIQLKPDRGFVRPLLPLMSPTSPEEVSQNEMNFLNPFLKKACEVWIEEGRNIVANEGEAEHYAYSNAVLRVESLVARDDLQHMSSVEKDSSTPSNTGSDLQESVGDRDTEVEEAMSNLVDGELAVDERDSDDDTRSENHSYTRSGFLAKGIDGLDDDNLGSDEGDSDSDSLEITVDCFKPITLASFGIDELELSPLTEGDTSLDEHMHDTDIEAVDVLHRSFDGGSKVKGVECEDDGFSANDVNDEQSVHDEPLSTQASPAFARTSIEDKAVGSTMESPSVNIGVDVNKLELKEASRTNDAALGSRVSNLKPEVVVDKDANGGQPESDTSNYSGKQTVQYADKAVQVDLLELEIPDVIPSPTQIGRSIDSKLDGDSDIGHSDAEGIDLSCEKNSTADVGCDAMESADMFCSSEDNCESESEASEVSTTIDLEMKREADHEVLEAITTGSKVGILGAPNEQTAAHSPFSSAECTNSEQGCGQGIIQRQKHADAAPSDLKSEKLELVYEMLREMRDSYFAKPLSDPVRDAGYREVSTNESKEVATKEVNDVRCRCPSPDRSKEFTPSSLKDLLSVGPISPQARNLACDDSVTRVPLGDEIHKGYVDNTKKVLPKLHLVERQMQGKRTRLDDTKSATILRGSLYNAGERKQFHDTQATLVSPSDMWITKQRKCLHSVVKKEEHSSARSLFAHDSETERIARIMQGSMNYWMKEDSSSSCDDEVSANEDTSDDDCYF